MQRGHGRRSCATCEEDGAPACGHMPARQGGCQGQEQWQPGRQPFVTPAGQASRSLACTPRRIVVPLRGCSHHLGTPSPAAAACRPPTLAAPVACGPVPRPRAPGPGRQTGCPDPRTGPPACRGRLLVFSSPGASTAPAATRPCRWAMQPGGLRPVRVLQAHSHIGHVASVDGRHAARDAPLATPPPSLTGASSYAASAAPSTPAAAAARSTRGPPASRLRSYSCRARGLLSTWEQGSTGWCRGGLSWKLVQ